MRRVPTLLACLSLLLSSLWLAACSDGQAAEATPGATRDGRIEVTFWHAMGGKQGGELNAIIDDFNALPDNPYFVTGVFQGNYDTLQQKLIASLYAGEPPVSAQMYESWTTRFLEFGLLQPVDHFIQNDPEFTEEDIADLVPAFREDSSYPLVETEKGYRLDRENGKPTLATLPFNKSLFVLYVNDTLMRQVGFEEPPETWDELRALARAMSAIPMEDGGRRYGFAVRPFPEAYTPFLFTAGANYMNEDGDFTFTGQEGHDAFALLEELTLGEEGLGYVESNYLNSPFGAGKIGMYIATTASFPFNDAAVGNKFIWRAYPLPNRDAETDGKVLAQGTNVGIFRRGYAIGTTVSEERQRGAWEFFKFLSSPEQTARWAMATGYMPVRQSAAELPVMQDYLASNPNFANAFSSLDRAAFEPNPIWWDAMRNILAREIDAVLNQRKTSEEALQAILEKAEAVRTSAEGKSSS